MPVRALTMAVAIVIPADGPSLGMPPAGHVDVQRVLLEDLALDAELRGVGAGPRQAGSRRLAHDLAELAGQDEVLAALHPGDLDGDDVAADLGHDQARRRAGLVLGLELAVLEALRAEQVGQLLRVDDGLALAALGDLPGDLAHDVGELALEVPDAGLVGVRADELGHRLVGDLDVLVLEAVVLHLLGDEEALADLDLLLLGVAGQVDDLHPVAEGRRDRVEQVGGRDEEDLARGRTAPRGSCPGRCCSAPGSRTSSRAELGSPRKSIPILSTSSSMNTGLFEPGRLDALDDPAGQRADVGAPVAADLGLVVDAAEAHPHELAAHRPGDALAERRLADAGRPDEGEDRAADLVGEGAHGEVLEDPLLDLLEAVVVLVEDPGGFLDVELVVGRDVPGQADQPVDVGPDDADLGRGGRDPAHPVDFLDRAGLDLVGHAGGLDLVAQLVDLGLLRVVLAQLALDRLELLAQDVLALGLVHLGLDLGLDPALQLEDLDLVGEEVRDELEALDDVDRLEHLLALLGGHVRAVGDHVGQQAGLADVARGDGRLRRDRGAVGDVLLDLGLDRAHQRLDLEAVGALVGELLDRRRGGTARSSVKPWTRRRPWPWTIARTVPSWSCTTWAILASVPIV